MREVIGAAGGEGREEGVKIGRAAWKSREETWLPPYRMA
jgi:hypothetical protein